GKKGCLTDTASFPAQENYLAQFISHVNPYTGIAYKDDPDIIAVEINDEPFYHGDRPDLTTEYINRMAGAIRGTGCEKPIFYNVVSFNIDQIDNFFSAADIQGGTLQWYPTGWAGHDQKGNMLPNVERYLIPFADHSRFRNMSKAVYEFDIADVGVSSYIYPAMARSFREAGVPFAAQFAYDPMYMAYANTDYYTHYHNLAYTPKKSMGMLLASEVFHRVPLGKSYGRYPDNSTFDAFRVSYEDDLAEMVTDEKFLYTNHTRTSPPKPEQLEHVAGTGSSPVVKYEGTGAYFLDRLEEGVWRLEVMPDAVWVKDPFERPPSLDKKVSVVLWKEWPMVIQLPDLGGDFSIEGLNDGNDAKMSAEGTTFQVRPGSYLLTRKGKTTDWDGNDSWNNIRLNEFYAPETNCKKTYVLHESFPEISLGSKHILTASVVSPEEPDQVELILMKTRQRQVIPMERTAGYEYEAEIPSEFIKSEGQLRYYISIKKEDTYYTFPSEIESHPFDWDFTDQNPWEIVVVNPENQVCLFDAERDGDEITTGGVYGYYPPGLEYIPSMVSGKLLMKVNVDNLNSREHNYSLRSYFLNKIAPRLDDLESKDELVVYGHSLNGKPCKLQLSLIMKDGTTYGGILTLDSKEDLYKMSLKDLKKVRRAILPTPLGFLPYWFEMNSNSKLDLTQVESLQISIGPGIPEGEYGDAHGVAIGRITIQ
ncbi:MAG: hypothetical protein GQ579_01415, partial [Bacteroidales bacterium]|nr:hypothetical protein [Bacteroidales bacterium]